MLKFSYLNNILFSKEKDYLFLKELRIIDTNVCMILMSNDIDSLFERF